MEPPPTSPAQADSDLAIDIRVLTLAELDAAVNLLALGMRGNPLHVEVFGTETERGYRRLRRFLGSLVAYVASNGMLLGASVQGELLGILGMIQPGRCQPGRMDWLRFAGDILTRHPPVRVWRIHRWLSAWAHNDPIEPHWHLGPMAVLPAWRRRGIARTLMTHGCQHVDRFAAMASLETDLAINAAFYKTMGFVVTRHENVLGVPNWFMTRPANMTEVSKSLNDGRN